MLRKIRTENEIKRVQKRNKIILGVIMIFLLAVAPLGFSLLSGGGSGGINAGSNAGPNRASIEESGFEFYYINGRFTFDLNGQVYTLTYLPSEIKDVNIEGNYMLDSYANKVLYFVGDEEATLEILNNIGRYASRYQEACINIETCAGDFPLKTCSDLLVIFQEGSGNETKVYQEDSCVYIVGDPIKGADAFLYKVLKVN